VDEHCGGACGCGVPDLGLERALTRRDEHRAPRDARDAVRPEEVGERGAVRGLTLRALRVRERGAKEPRDGKLALRRERAHDRCGCVERPAPVDGEPRADGEDLEARVERAHGEGVGRTPGRPHRAEGAAAAAVVPGRGDDERAEPGGAGDRPGLRAVWERRVRLDHRRERHGGRVVDVAVPVRVDRPLEPGEEHVTPPEERVRAVGRALPAEHSDREDARPRGDAGEARGAVQTDQDPGHARAVRLDAVRLVRLALGGGAPIPVDEVEARRDASVEERVLEVDPSVEERNPDARPVEAGKPDVGAAPGAGAELGPPERLGCDGGRVDGADGVDARDRPAALELRLGACVHDGREAVQRAGEGAHAAQADAALAEPLHEDPLGRIGLGDPALLLGTRRRRLRGRHAIGERGSPEDDDHPLSGGRARAVAEDVAPRASGRLRGRLARSANRVDDGHESREDRDGDQRGGPGEHARPRKRTHRGQDSRERRWPGSTGPRTRSWRRCRCRARAA
jgi:hypothetical protein